MSKSKIIEEIAALRATALDDLMATSDAELCQEIIEDGKDPDAIAMQVKSAMRDAAASSLRQRLAQAKIRITPVEVAPTRYGVRPTITRIKQIVQELFQRDSSLGLAFRDGKRQTESDWQSLYDDLVAMGAINPDDEL